ncbi:MAG: hypothetical protein V4451_02475 [Pseudomonadota bacterium]
MIYLYWYLGVGTVVLAVVFGAHRLTKKEKTESLLDILDAVNPDRKKLSYRILNNVVAPVLAAVAVVVVWPVAVYMKVKDVFGEKSESPMEEEREFAVECSHLQERLTVPQIEAREVVADPMGAVPNLSFGHLNAAWKAFIEGVVADDEIWSFTAPWQTTWGRKEIRSGYVVVRGAVPTSHFLTMWKEIEDESEDTQGSAGPSTDSSKKTPGEIPAWLRKQAD